MRKAYVLIQTELGSAHDVAQALQGKPEFLAADVVMGNHDVICLIQGSDPEVLAGIVVNDIQSTHGVRTTTTYMVIGVDKS